MAKAKTKLEKNKREKIKEERIEVKKTNRVYGGGGELYGVGVIGALVYFLQNIHNFQGAILGIIKALVWPAIIVFKVLQLLHA